MTSQTQSEFVVIPVRDELLYGREHQHRATSRPGETAIETERRRRREMNELNRVVTDAVTISDVSFDQVGVRLFTPQLEGPLPCLVWFHGGGWIYGTNEGDDGMLAQFADQAGIAVASVEYRLAPEHPYPAAIDDADRVFSHLLSGAFGVDPTRLILGGSSAGATIAAGLALKVRDRGESAFGQFLLCPALDDAATGDDPTSLFSRNQMSEFWHEYTQGSADPYAVPARATQLGGLPRTYICTTSGDPLRMEAWEYATRLAAAGVEIEAQFLPGGYHGFEYEVPNARFSRDAVQLWAGVLASMTRRAPGGQEAG